MIEVFEVLICYEKEGVLRDTENLEKIGTATLMGISHRNGNSKETEGVEKVDVMTHIKQMLVGFFDKNAGIISEFSMDEELYRIIEKYNRKTKETCELTVENVQEDSSVSKLSNMSDISGVSKEKETVETGQAGRQNGWHSTVEGW